MSAQISMENNKTIVIFTDAGSKMDPDDETALYWLFKIFDHSKYNFHIVIGGAGNGVKMINFFGKYIDFNEMKNVYIHQYEKVDNATIYPSLNQTIAPDYIINISPQIDNIFGVISFDNLKSVAIMGNKSSSIGYNQINPNCIYDSSFALNDGGSEKFHDFLLTSQTPVFTVTSKECRFTYNMFSEELFKDQSIFGPDGLPDDIIVLIRQSVFKNVGGRLDPNIINSSNVFLITAAIGLINPEIKGANYNDTKGIADLLDINIDSDSVTVIIDACKNYMDLLNLKNQEFIGKPIDNEIYEKTLKYLIDLEINVAKIFNQIPVINGRLITSNEGDLHIKYASGYNNFVRIGKYSPAFDLVTVRNFMNFIEK